MREARYWSRLYCIVVILSWIITDGTPRYDTPLALLSDPNSRLYQLAKDSGDFDVLLKSARENAR